MEFVTIAFSTFLGAAVALGAERLTRIRDARLIEEAGINNLILDLAAKRAFLAGENWTWMPGEIKRVVGSVYHARNLTRSLTAQVAALHELNPQRLFPDAPGSFALHAVLSTKNPRGGP